jgi:hypothetical protein
MQTRIIRVRVPLQVWQFLDVSARMLGRGSAEELLHEMLVRLYQQNRTSKRRR